MAKLCGRQHGRKNGEVRMNDVVTESMVKTLFDLFPIAMILGIAIGILNFIRRIPSETTFDEYEEDDEIEEEIEIKKSASDILAERFARGELTDEEYTEKMARL